MIGRPEHQQLDAKLGVVKAALSNAGLEFPSPRWVRSDARIGYRNRLRLRIDENGALGFFNPNKAHDCKVLEPRLVPLIHRLREFAICNPEYLRPFAHVEVRSPDADASSGACFSPRDRRFVFESTRRSLSALGTDVLVSVQGAVPPEAVPRQRWLLSDDVYCYVPLDAFMQVNTQVNRSLCSAVRALATAHDVKTAFDFYAGSGNFTLPLLAAGIRAVAVETHASAAHALRLAAEAQGLGPLQVMAADAAAVAAILDEGGHRCDLLVVDAPRAGVRNGLESMARLSNQHVALVSCNPQTLAKDLLALDGFGFGIREILLFDMFAQTRHVEVLAWLSRK